MNLYIQPITSNNKYILPSKFQNRVYTKPSFQGNFIPSSNAGKKVLSKTLYNIAQKLINSVTKTKAKPVEEILTANSARINLSKFSILSKPNRVKAFRPDFSNPANLKEKGLIFENNNWYVPNRKDFPGAIKENDIVINYGKNPDGKTDLGTYSQKDFEDIYVNSKDYDSGKIRPIRTSNFARGEYFYATKCASGGFCFVPTGTKIKIKNGLTRIKPGEIIMINDGENNLFISKFNGAFISRYMPDPMNPAAKAVYNLIKNAGEDQDKLSPQKLAKLHKALYKKINNLPRTQKMYKIRNASESEKEISLQQEYKLASNMANKLESEIFQRINALNFNERLEQAKIVLQDIVNDKSLTDTEKRIRISAVQVRLLPKTNNHQHLKGSVSKDFVINLLQQKGRSSEIPKVENAYTQAEKGFDKLEDFNKGYAIITDGIDTIEDLKSAIKSNLFNAVKQGQMTAEIRTAIYQAKDSSGKIIESENYVEAIIDAIKNTCKDIKRQGGEPPKVGFVGLLQRTRAYNFDEQLSKANVLINVAKKHPEMKFGMDIAGPEEVGHKAMDFKPAIDAIKEYNKQVEQNKIKAEKIGITIHSGETPKYNGVEGYNSVAESIKLGADRIGHGLQATNSPEVMKKLKESGMTVEICGVCNISSIPANTKEFKQHPIQEFIKNNIPITLCTDNDAVCGTNLSKEYMLFMLTGHDMFMNWNTVKKVAENGIKVSFIKDSEKNNLLNKFQNRIRIIENTTREYLNLLN
jgi:adenosine deaminase